MLRYNTAVSRVNPNVIKNVYINRTVINREHHVYATPVQRQRMLEASNDRHSYSRPLVITGAPGTSTRTSLRSRR